MRMKKLTLTIAVIGGLLLTAGGPAISAQENYAVQVPVGLAFSEFRGYEGWLAISMSRNDKAVAVILGNPAMIGAHRAGIPANGKPVPDGARMAKIHWVPKTNAFFPDAAVPGKLLNVEFMVKDTRRFADSGGWGFAVLDYDGDSDTFKPGTSASKPPRKGCQVRFACHTTVKSKDGVFME